MHMVSYVQILGYYAGDMAMESQMILRWCYCDELSSEFVSLALALLEKGWMLFMRNQLGAFYSSTIKVHETIQSSEWLRPLVLCSESIKDHVEKWSFSIPSSGGRASRLQIATGRFGVHIAEKYLE